MAGDWKEVVIDPIERKVFEALADPLWDFRTAEGISKATGLSLKDVESTLSKYPELVRRSTIPDAQGRDLYTLQIKPVSTQERWAEIRSFVTKSPSGR